MALRELQERMLIVEGAFQRSASELLAMRLKASACLLVSALLIGLLVRASFSRMDAFLAAMLVFIVVLSTCLSVVLFRRASVRYEILAGLLSHQRPIGTARWQEQLSSVESIVRGADWLGARWIVLKFSDHKRRVEYLPSLEAALYAVQLPPNKSLERTRDG